MPQLLITGGTGFIGFMAAKYALSIGWTTRVLDNLTSGQITNKVRLEEMGAEVVIGDIRDAEVVEAAMQGVDAVIHLAAQVSVSLSIDEPENTHEVNVKGTELILASAIKNSISALVMASSAAVYGNCEDFPLTESTPSMCLSPYAESKLKNEEQIKTARLDGLNATAVRLFNVYGEGQQPLGAYAAVIPKFISLISQGKSPIIYGDGTHTRDFVHVQDAVKAIFLIINTPAELNPFHIYNIGTGISVSLNDLVQNVNTAFSKCMDGYSLVAPKYQDERQGDIRHSIASIQRIHAELGWTASILFDDGINDQVKKWVEAESK